MNNTYLNKAFCIKMWILFNLFEMYTNCIHVNKLLVQETIWKKRDLFCVDKNCIFGGKFISSISFDQKYVILLRENFKLEDREFNMGKKGIVVT